MAIDTKDFINKVETGLKANKDYTRFFYSFTKDSKRKRGLIDYSDKSWDMKERKKAAKAEFIKKQQIDIADDLGFTDKSPLNIVADKYFQVAVTDSKWDKERASIYNVYIGNLSSQDKKAKNYHKNDLGTKKISELRTLHIDTLIKQMEKSGYSKQNKDGCSPRTIKKVIFQVLKPILEYAYDNKVIDEVPKIKTIKQTAKKKHITGGTNKLTTLFQTINTLYADNAFYRALFLFALYGRRWNEIRTLRWKDITLEENTYTIRGEVNKVDQNQTYTLPEPIRFALLDMKENHQGLVFKSPKTGNALHSPRKQLDKIKEMANIPELTMHLFRHILVTALGESEITSSVLSASLGHTNEATVKKHYQTINHTKESERANNAVQGLLNEH